MSDTDHRTTRLLIVVGVSFFAAGMAQGTLGPVLPDLARRTGTDPAIVGGMFTAFMLALFLGQTAAAIFGGRLGRTRVLAIGMTLAVAGYCGIALGTSFAMLVAFSVLNGLGFGTLALTGNVAAAESSPGAGPLNLVNAAFGVGAIVGPALVWLSLGRTGTGIPALWGAAIAMSTAFVLLIALRPDTGAARPPGPVARDGRHAARAMLNSPVIWLLGTFCMFQVSLEVGLGAWLPTLLARAADMSPAAGASVISMFWLLATTARLVAAGASRTLHPLKILKISTWLCVSGCMLLLLATARGDGTLAVIAVAVLAPGLGPVVPTALAVARAAFPDDARLASGFVFGMNTVGAAAAPLVLGLLLGSVGPVAVSAACLLYAGLLATTFAAIARTLDGRAERLTPTA